MSSAAGPLLKPLSMANACLTSLPSIFITKTSFPFISSLPSKPIKSLHISCSSSSSSGFPSSWVSLKNKSSSSSSSSMVAMVASTSDWAQTEDSEVEEEDEAKWENDEGGEVGGSYSYSEPPEEAKLFVANLPYDVDSQKLAVLFQQAGIVEMAEVIYNRQTDQSRGFAFVTMSTIEEAEKAIEMFHRYDINGRLLTVNKAGEKDSRPGQPRRDFESNLRIYVGNLPWEVDSARLEQLFSEFGKVVDARVLTDRETGNSRGFGFVTMSTQTEVEDAINALNGQDLDGRTIKVNVSEQRERRNSFTSF